MTNLTIQMLAVEIKTSVDYIIQSFLDIGIVKTKSDFVSSSEKEMLLKYINQNDSSIFKKQLTLRRKTRSTLSVSGIGGKNKQVQVEVRKKRIYIQQSCISKISEFINLSHNSQKAFLDLNSDDNKSNVIDKKNTLIERKIDDSVVVTPLIQKNRINYFSNSCSRLNNKNNQEKRFIASKTREHVTSKTNNVILKENNNHHDFYDNVSHSIYSLEKKYDNNEHIKCVTLPEEKNNYHKLDGDEDRRYRSRVRARCRSGGGSKQQLIRQKRNINNQRLLYNTMMNNPDGEEEQLLSYNKVINKVKRKQSALIQNFNKPEQAIVHTVVIGETISVSELSNKMSMKGSYVIKEMMKLGLMATINQILDQETAQLIVEEMGHNVILRNSNELEELIMNDRKNTFMKSNNIIVENRAPIVTVMGHVDHGKTTLLDYIRSTRVAFSEIGGITQKIGAYHVRVNKNKMITFIDTPGHAAFTAMRARGVKLTDIVVLVVASDDGVMPQTVEAIEHIRVANVPVIVAINKIDKLTSNPDRIKNELNNYRLVPEDWGGDTQFINISAISGKGIDDLLEAILLQSEMLELKVAKNGMASAVVIESFLDKGRGPVITALVREGTLKCGDIVLCGTEYGRVRSMRNEYGHAVITAGPSIPVELVGLSGAPGVGEMVVVVRSEKKARELALYRQGKFRDIKLTRKPKESDDIKDIFNNIAHTNTNSELNLIVKSDTIGSIEALRESLVNLSTHELTVKIISTSIGGINESDATLAVASGAIILGFNVKADTSARRIIESNKLNVRYYSVIYDMLSEIKQIMSGMLVTQNTSEIIGLAEVRHIFRLPKYGNIAGCIVVEGIVKRNGKIKVVRDHMVICEGELESLRRFKIDVVEVRNGMECGIGVKNYNDIHIGDRIEVYENIIAR